MQANTLPEHSFVEQFGSVADELRQIAVDFGMRPYRVFVVAVESVQGKRQTVSETELLPTPVVDLSGQRSEFKAGGKAERGTIRVTEISPRYTEAQITGMFHVKQGREVFVEIVHDSRDGEGAKRRRFGVRGVPWRDAENLQWIVKLEQEAGTRAEAGPRLHPEREAL